MESKYEKYKGMRWLLSGPFYQCWAEFEECTAEEILQESINEAKDFEVDKALDELEQIFNKVDKTEVMIDLIGYGFNCSYAPSADGKSDIEWLVEIKQKLMAQKNRINKGSCD